MKTRQHTAKWKIQRSFPSRKKKGGSWHERHKHLVPRIRIECAVSRYVQKLGAQLASHAPAPAYPYTFKVVNQKEINAFALPGGPIYVNLGTIQAADNESQLAGVMAHEISHVVMRHATAAATKQMLAQAP